MCKDTAVIFDILNRTALRCWRKKQDMINTLAAKGKGCFRSRSANTASAFIWIADWHPATGCSSLTGGQICRKQKQYIRWNNGETCKSCLEARRLNYSQSPTVEQIYLVKGWRVEGCFASPCAQPPFIYGICTPPYWSNTSGVELGKPLGGEHLFNYGTTAQKLILCWNHHPNENREHEEAVLNIA